jgi:protocatechuate 3,4-dioxygenase beta subunit
MMTFLLAIVVATAAQPERDTFNPNKGTGRISGSVTAADTGLPIRRATVRLGASGGPTLTMNTDANGRFEFTGLPAAKFTVMVTKAGFVQMPFTTRPFGVPDRGVDLSAGQRVDMGDIRMARGGVVTGRVFDEFGDPMAEAFIQVFRATYAQGVRRLMPIRGMSSNDIGQFRIYGLQPGTYYVTGTLRATEMVTHGEPLPPKSSDAGGFAPTFYPGVVSAIDARPIAVEAAQEVANLEFALQPVRLVRLSGRAVDSQGRPVKGAVVMLNAARADGLTPGGVAIGEVKPDGAFTFSSVVPGEYRIDVRAKSAFEAMAQKGGPGVGMPQAADAPEFASVPLTVLADVDGVVVTTSRGHTLTGRVTVDGATPDAAVLKKASVVTHDATTGASMSAVMLSAGAAVRPDGTFEIRGAGGTRIIRVQGLPAGWFLKSVRADGIDVTDLGLDVRSDTSDVEITVTARPSSISGVVTDSRGRRVGDRTVIIFPEDPARRSGLMNRYVTSARAAADGSFTIAALPAGHYFAAVLQAVVDDEWQAPENLERAQGSATKFILTEGENKSLQLVVK